MSSQEETNAQTAKMDVSEDSTRTPTANSVEPAKSEAAADDSSAQPKSEDEPTRNPRLEALAAKKANLEATVASLQAQRSALVAETKLPSGLAMPETWSEDEKTKSALTTANAAIKDHIALLHKYNEIKDIGQGLMGLIADQRGVRVAKVMDEFGMGEKD